MRSITPFRTPYWTTATLPLADLRNEMERLFGRMFDGARGSTTREDAELEFAPHIDVSETDKEIVVSAEVPGIAPEEIDVTVKDGVLTLQGEKKQEATREDENVHVVERHYGRFRRSFTLPSAVDFEKIDAQHANGVLTIRLPKSDTTRAHKIEVRSK